METSNDTKGTDNCGNKKTDSVSRHRIPRSADEEVLNIWTGKRRDFFHLQVIDEVAEVLRSMRKQVQIFGGAEGLEARGRRKRTTQ